MQCGPLVYPCRIWYMKVLFLRETKLALNLSVAMLFVLGCILPVIKIVGISRIFYDCFFRVI